MESLLAFLLVSLRECRVENLGECRVESQQEFQRASLLARLSQCLLVFLRLLLR